jgi:hypothetical protein
VIVKMIVEKQMECRLAGETEVLRENLLEVQLSSAREAVARGPECGKRRNIHS